jgi:trigger factor
MLTVARIFDVAERIRNRKTLDFITTKVKVKEVDEPKKQEEKTEKTVSKAKKK